MAWHDELVANAEMAPKKQDTFYSVHGDCLEVFFETGLYTGKRIDDLVTVYVSEETGLAVGILMKGAKAFLSGINARLPSTAIDFSGNKFSIEYLITAYLWTRAEAADQSDLTLLIQVRDAARRENIEFQREAVAG